MGSERPLRFVVSGLSKAEIARAVEQTAGDRAQADIMTDMEGARAVKNGDADFFVGSCATGQGGALAAAIALLGYGNCVMVGGKNASRADIESKVLSKNWKAFGVRTDQVEMVVPALVDTLLRRTG